MTQCTFRYVPTVHRKIVIAAWSLTTRSSVALAGWGGLHKRAPSGVPTGNIFTWVRFGNRRFYATALGVQSTFLYILCSTTAGHVLDRLVVADRMRETGSDDLVRRETLHKEHIYTGRILFQKQASLVYWSSAVHMGFEDLTIVNIEVKAFKDVTTCSLVSMWVRHTAYFNLIQTSEQQ
jgi:hypothetical protein